MNCVRGEKKVKACRLCWSSTTWHLLVHKNFLIRDLKKQERFVSHSCRSCFASFRLPFAFFLLPLYFLLLRLTLVFIFMWHYEGIRKIYEIFKYEMNIFVSEFVAVPRFMSAHSNVLPSPCALDVMAPRYSSLAAALGLFTNCCFVLALLLTTRFSSIGFIADFTSS